MLCGWAGLAARIGEWKGSYTSFVGATVRVGDYLEDPGVNGSSRSGMAAWIELIWLRIGTSGVLL